MMQLLYARYCKKIRYNLFQTNYSILNNLSHGLIFLIASLQGKRGNKKKNKKSYKDATPVPLSVIESLPW